MYEFLTLCKISRFIYYYDTIYETNKQKIIHVYLKKKKLDLDLDLDLPKSAVNLI